MKKAFIITVICLATTFITNAQIEKGKVFVGGNVSLNHTNFNGRAASHTTFDISPNIGYFTSDNLAIGTALGYSRSKYNLDEEDLSSPSNNSFYISPFVRFLKGNELIHFFAQLSATVGWINQGDNALYKTNYYSAQLSPGVIVFPTGNIGIELAIQGLTFLHNRQKPDTAYDADYLSISNTFGLGANFMAPRLGVQFYF